MHAQEKGLDSRGFLQNRSLVSLQFHTLGENSMVSKGNADSKCGDESKNERYGIKEAESSLLKWIPIPYGY